MLCLFWTRHKNLPPKARPSQCSPADTGRPRAPGLGRRQSVRGFAYSGFQDVLFLSPLNRKGSKENIFICENCSYLKEGTENLVMKFMKPSGLPTTLLVMGSLPEMPQPWLTVKTEWWYASFLTVNPKTRLWWALLHFWRTPSQSHPPHSAPWGDHGSWHLGHLTWLSAGPWGTAPSKEAAKPSATRDANPLISPTVSQSCVFQKKKYEIWGEASPQPSCGGKAEVGSPEDSHGIWGCLASGVPQITVSERGNASAHLCCGLHWKHVIGSWRTMGPS